MTDEDTKCVGICPNEAIQFYVPLNDSVYFSSLPDGPLSGELLKGRCKNHFVHINDMWKEVSKEEFLTWKLIHS
jgi:hypothetical protein